MPSASLPAKLVAVATLALAASACHAVTCKDPGGAVTGPADAHCTGVPAQAVNQASCHPADPNTNAETPDYGDTMYNDEGHDDDCKYIVNWSVTPVCQAEGVTFDVHAVRTTDGSAVTGANPEAEVYLSDVHPAPNSNSKTVELGNGNYTIGPILFDASGQWTVRFHFFETCDDSLPDSPHGHAAFYVQVP